MNLFLTKKKKYILTFIAGEDEPLFMSPILLGKIKPSNTLLCKDAHIDLKTQKGEHRERKYRQNDHIPQILH